MQTRTKVIVTAVLGLGLIGLGLADAYVNDGKFTASLTPKTVQTSSTQTVVGGVAKMDGVNVEDALKEQGMTTKKTSEESMLAQIVQTGSTLNALSVLQNGDRIGAVLWIDSPSVKEAFSGLKDALLTAFSPNVQDLQDQTIQDNGPVRNILTFLDPALSAERLSFVRVRERLYEFHIAAGKEAQMQGVIDKITAL